MQIPKHYDLVILWIQWHSDIKSNDFADNMTKEMTVNDLPVDRSVDKTLRLVQAFQFTDEHGEVYPANWKPGQKTMVADPKKSQEYFAAAS